MKIDTAPITKQYILYHTLQEICLTLQHTINLKRINTPNEKTGHVLVEVLHLYQEQDSNCEDDKLC